MADAIPRATGIVERSAPASPRARARLAGLFELLEGLTGAFGQVIVPSTILVHGDAAATATKVLAHEPLMRLGFASSLLSVAFHLAWAVLLYELLRPVQRTVSLLAISVMVAGCAIQALSALLGFAPLVVLQNGTALGALTAAQLQAIAFLFLRLNAVAYDIYLFCFGVWCALTGYLVFRSMFLPRALGVLFAISGLGWMMYIDPPVAVRLFPVIAAASALGEVTMTFWLLVAGVNVERWRTQAAEASLGGMS